MSKSVDHIQRKEKILRKALELFASVGYPQVTYQQIADHCGLTRTTLYQYFPTKLKILDAAIIYLVHSISDEVLRTFAQNRLKSASQQLSHLLRRSLEILIQNSALMKTLVEYLIAQARQGENTQRKIQRHTILFRRFVRNILAQGIESGEFRQLNPREAEDAIFAFIQAEVIRILFTDSEDRQLIFRHCDNFIQLICQHPAK